MTGTAAKVPARVLPILYLGTAHVSLALACLSAALWPHAVAGFFYHPWLIGLVHLVTLGWIAFSIVGAMYIVGPLALRMDMRVRGKYCPADDLRCGNGTIRTMHPCELFGDDWLEWSNAPSQANARSRPPAAEVPGKAVI